MFFIFIFIFIFIFQIIKNAACLALKILKENGAQNAVDAFYRHLPLTDMICDISVGMGQIKLAQVRISLFDYLVVV